MGFTPKGSDKQFEGPFVDVSDLKNTQGIYVVLDKRDDGKFYRVDVGEADDVKDRIENHDREDCWESEKKGTLAFAVRYTPGSTKEGRVAEETKIRDALPTPCGSR